MAKEKSIVEEAILQMKNLEEAVAENAKGILASTMKEEIKELVKESLNEQGEEEVDMEVDMEEPEMEDEDEMDSDEMDMGMEMDTDNIEDDEPIDLTDKSDEEVLRVFQLMGPDDHIVVTKDDSGNISVKDTETDKEYMIVGEGEESDYTSMEEDMYEMVDDSEMGDAMMDDTMMEDDDVTPMMEMGFEDSEEEFGKDDIEGMISRIFNDVKEEDESMVYEIDMNEESDDNEDDDDDTDEESEGIVYEIEMDEEVDEEYGQEDEGYLEEAKKSIKAKGVGMGKPSKFKYSKNPNQGEGFKVVKKNANKTMGTGSAKKGFSYDKNGENLDGEFKIKPKGIKKAETKEAARTYGNGSKEGRGLRKGITPNRNLKFESVDSSELQLLREKNEEYRKALNVFRNKLNEVAVFNSNLAYATRLFTEHSTSKQEKINILRRFDSVETLKESKNLYKSIKDELSGSSAQPMNESIGQVIEKAPSTGSAINLIESKTYENPQFLRMKDLMNKLK
jgi:hypothetical protein